MPQWLKLLLAYLAGSFLGVSTVLGFFRGAATPKAASAPA